MSHRIFLCYRRDDEPDAVHRLKGHLRRYFEDQVFIDKDGIPAGADFEKVLDNQIEECDVLLAVIGRSWLTTKDNEGPRLGRPGDHVTHEIARATEVIPILVAKASMPKVTDLPQILVNWRFDKRNAFEIQPENFEARSDLLVERLRQVLKEADAARKASNSQEKSTPSTPKLSPFNEWAKELLKLLLPEPGPREAVSGESPLGLCTHVGDGRI